MVDQPTAKDALSELEPWLGEWTLNASSPDGQPWPGEAPARFEWHETRAHLVARTTVDVPGAPSEAGAKISGRWEKAEDGVNYTTDFCLTYTRVR